MDDYSKFRGKCKELSQAEIEKDPSLHLVRGWYHCPIWGKQQHWWCVRRDGTILDPTARQFPSKGTGEYEQYNGQVECEYCKKSIPETEAEFRESHVYCSYACYGHDVGF